MAYTDDFETYLVKEVIGPSEGVGEWIIDRPRDRYLMGTLFPQGAMAGQVRAEGEEAPGRGGGDGNDDGGDEPDSPIAMAYERLPASLGVSFMVQGTDRLRVEVSCGSYQRYSWPRGSARALADALRAAPGPVEIECPADDIRQVLDRGIPAELIGVDDATLGVWRDAVDDPGPSVTLPIPEPVAAEFRRRMAPGAASPLPWVMIPIWKRTGMCAGGEGAPLEIVLPAAGGRVELEVLDGRASLVCIVRPRNDGQLVTVSLVNSHSYEGQEQGRVQDEDCLFQASLRCSVVGGNVGSYPRIDRLAHDEEEDELTLLYRDKPVYALGHGCAAWWDSNGDPVETVESRYMPKVEIKPLTHETRDGADSPVLSLSYLSDSRVDPLELTRDLRDFVNGYGRWLRELEEVGVPQGSEAARDRIIGRISAANDRLESGVKLLENDVTALAAFRLANRSMLMQMVHGGDSYGGGNHARNERPYIEPEYSCPATKSYRWRPFQLAFQLLCLRGMWDEDSPDRDLVDLIWFPTGGGKTEAYLAVAAFEIFRRRLIHGDTGGGTCVIKRYTLRLLTNQQFLRAAALACACEVIRTGDPERLGAEPISIGLWVGDSAAPNRITTGDPDRPGARELYHRLRSSSPTVNPFPVRKCPWCGTRLAPVSQSDDDGDYGFDIGADQVRVFCPTETCPFHESLPLQFVDEVLYRSPPTFLIGTVDKFARIPWEPRTSMFFGGGNRLPPSLIIQDEMHLISGPLGTISGMYEAAIDTVIRDRGTRTKVVAATATIRRAGEQSVGLYGREVAVFPPPGLHSDDSYFSRVDSSNTGRTYLGVLAQSQTPVTALVRTAAALVQLPKTLTLPESVKDAWWTQIIYHNSKRELGKTMTLARDDIPARIDATVAIEEDRRPIANVEELSSNVDGERIPAIIEQLGRDASQQDAIDILPCTNMIQVGVDFPRLGLMLMNGQPKTTSEYIQATSRVGRKPSRYPGVVVVLYSGTKPRDRSHYEGFTGFHRAIYRYVEPTSVTPFAQPARDRTLHAAIVAIARLVGGLPRNEDAERFTPEEVGRSFEALRARISEAAGDETEEALLHFDDLVAEWTAALQDSRERQTPLRYQSRGRQHMALLRQFHQDQQHGVWGTLNSMRNVDVETPVRIAGVEMDGDDRGQR